MENHKKMKRPANMLIITVMYLIVSSVHAFADSSWIIIQEDSIQPETKRVTTQPLEPVQPDIPFEPEEPGRPIEPSGPSVEDEELIPIDHNNQYAVGTPKGSFNVNSMGAAVYSVNIECPNGGALMPAINIVYNSLSGHGLAGYGFGLNGLSAITRGGSNLYDDGVLRGTTYTAGDNLYLDGKRLILKSGTAFSDGAVYTVAGDPYTTVTVHGTCNNTTANMWFEVHTADGNTYHYGNSTTSRLSYYNKKGLPRIASWYISYSEDSHANSISYTYETTNLNIRPTIITYGTNREKSRGITNTITFGYRSLGDRAQPFVIEDKQGKADVVLTDITTATNGETYRRYNFKYDEVSDKGHARFSRLVQIDELNGKGERLSPIKIDWNFIDNMSVYGRTLDVKTTDIPGYVKELSKQFMAADVNGDGVSDIIRISQVEVVESQGNGYTQSRLETRVYISNSHVDENNTVAYDHPVIHSLPATTSALDFITIIGGTSVMDFDGDGYNDLLVPFYKNDTGQGYERFYIIYGGDGTTGQSGTIDKKDILLVAAHENPLFVTSDTNGNGRDDVIFMETAAKDGYYHGGILYMDTGCNYKYDKLKFRLPSNPGKMFTADFNNDGLQDIILLYSRGYTIYYNNGTASSGQIFSESNKTTGTGLTDNWRVHQGDFDGDGLIDFVYNVSTETWLCVARNNGDGTFTHSRSEDIELSDQSTSKDDHKFSILVWDMNNDGKSDVFVSKAKYKHHGGINGSNDYEYTRIKWLYSDGTTLKVFNEADKYHPEDATEGYLMLGDFNGDGAVELANYGTMLSSNSETLDEKIHVYSTGTSSPGQGRVKRITNGLGRNIDIRYASAAMPSVYKKANDSQYPVNSYCLPMTVVASTSISNGASDTQYTKYKYGGLRLHIAGKGMLGFDEVTTENITTGVKEKQTVTARDDRRLVPTEVRQTTTIDNCTQETVVYTTVTDTDDGNYVAYTSKKETVDFDGNRTISNTVYDIEKGVVTEETVKDGEYDMYRKTVSSGYERKGGRWLPATVIATQKHKDSATPFTDMTEYTYDDKGNITAKTEHSGTDMEIVTSATYDIYGNILSSLSSGRGVIPITKHSEYDTSGRFVIRVYENPEAAVNTFTYDIWGNVTEESDVTEPGNVLTTRHTYDAWGRKTSTTEADGTLTEWETGWGRKQKYKYYIYETSSNKPWKRTWFDECSRETFVQSVGEKNVNVTKETTYDRSGNISKTESKTGELVTTEEFTYDGHGRVLSSVSSTGMIKEYEYGNRSVVCIVAGRGYTKTYDAWGNIVSSTDPVSEVTYKYYSNGKPAIVSTDGTEVTMAYDAAGNRTSLTDPDAGTSTYTYAADGRLLKETDGRGVETVYDFDESGRIRSSTTGTTTTTYTYGTSGYGAQRLIRKDVGNNSVEYTYDKFGRVTEERRNTGDKGTYTFRHTYNSDNMLEKTCYPGGLEVCYLYDEFGFRTQVKAGDNIVCNVEDCDGLKYSTSFMDSVTVVNTRDTRGFMSNRSLLYGTEVTETLGLVYDGETGNLMSRQRNDRAEEKFGYDCLDRLVSVNSGNTDTVNIAYAPNGNILNKTGIGNYEYDEAYKPHAVTAVDNTGGIIPVDMLKTEYDDFGRIKTIELQKFTDMIDGNELSKDSMTMELDTSRINMFRPMDAETMACGYGINEFPIINLSRPFIMNVAYGPDGERWYSSLTNSGRTISSTVYAGDYEKVTENGITREFYYLDGNTIIVKQDGVFKPYIAFTDNLGSILAVVDEEGNKVFEASYDAWGRQTVVLNTIGLKRGYTGHEMLNMFGLINMNGRLYDPLLGRFLSPDNYVQMPDNSQNFNRYSYCLNNPLKYNDPSGEFFGIDDMLFFSITSGAMMGFMNAKMTGSNLLKGTIMGGVSSVASYGVGSAFGHGLGTLGHELLRAGAHGLTNGVINAINGDKFGAGFITGMAASLAGSAAQAMHFNSLGVIGTSAITGGLASWASGGDLFGGALTGLNIGALNHEWVTINGEQGYMLDEVVVYYNATTQSALEIGNICGNMSAAMNILYGFNKYVEKCRQGTNGKFYLPKNNGIFYGNQYVKTSPVKGLKYLEGYSNIYTLFSDGFNLKATYIADGNKVGINTKRYISRMVGREIGGRIGVLAGEAKGGLIGAKMGPYGVIAGSIIGGIAGGYVGNELGSYAGEYFFDTFLNK